jgi:hypothetical protein
MFNKPLFFEPCEPIIPELVHNHITCCLQDLVVKIQQMKQKSIIDINVGYFEISEYLHQSEQLLIKNKDYLGVMYRRRIMEFFSPISENLDMSASMSEVYQMKYRSM